jgi:hypothetical protein
VTAAGPAGEGQALAVYQLVDRYSLERGRVYLSG